MTRPDERRERLPARAPAPEELVGLLADGVRRRMVAALIQGNRGRSELFDAAGCAARERMAQLRRLEHAGVVREVEDDYRLVDDVFERSVRDATTRGLGPLNDEHTQLARRYFFRNRLLQIPTEPWALEVVLDLIAEDFQPGEVYDEREVNTTLYGWNGDWATLRRLLVDRGYLGRDRGRYWRLRVPLA